MSVVYQTFCNILLENFLSVKKKDLNLLQKMENKICSPTSADLTRDEYLAGILYFIMRIISKAVTTCVTKVFYI